MAKRARLKRNNPGRSAPSKNVVEKFYEDIPGKLWILVIVSLCSRLLLVFNDLPPFQFCDEVIFHGEVARMISSGDLLPIEYRAGGFNIYPAFFLFIIINFFLPEPLSFTQMLIVGRVLYVAILPSLSILFVYKISTLFASKRTALYTSVLFCFSLFYHSNFWYPDNYVQFAVLGFLFYMLRIYFYESISNKDLRLMGFFLGLSISTKFTTLALIFPLLFFFGLRLIRQGRANESVGKYVNFLYSFILSASVLNLGLFFKSQEFIDGFFFNVNNYGDFPGIRLQGFTYYIGILLFNSFGIFGLLCLLLGALYFRKELLVGFGLCLYPLIIILALGDREWVVSRNMASAIPFLLPFIAKGIEFIETALLSKGTLTRIGAIFVIATAIPTLYVYVNNSIGSLRVDTRVEAKNWLSTNVKTNLSIGTNEFCSGDSPASVAGFQTVLDPELKTKADYYVFNSYWVNPFTSNFMRKGVLTLGDQSKIHFEQWNSTRLFGLINESEILNSDVPEGYIIAKHFSGNGPDIFILRKYP